MKTCTKCEQLKPLSLYSREKKSKNGRASACKECIKVYRKQYYHSNKEQAKVDSLEYYHSNKNYCVQRQQQYYQDNKECVDSRNKRYYLANKEAVKAYKIEHARINYEQYMLTASKQRAKKRDIEHTITIDDIVIPDKCPYLGVTLTRTRGKGQVLTNASLDRIDSTKGYTPNNIQVLSCLANTMKSNATKEQLITFANAILRIYPS